MIEGKSKTSPHRHTKLRDIPILHYLYPMRTTCGWDSISLYTCERSWVYGVWIFFWIFIWGTNFLTKVFMGYEFFLDIFQISSDRDGRLKSVSPLTYKRIAVAIEDVCTPMYTPCSALLSPKKKTESKKNISKFIHESNNIIRAGRGGKKNRRKITAYLILTPTYTTLICTHAHMHTTSLCTRKYNPLRSYSKKQKMKRETSKARQSIRLT